MAEFDPTKNSLKSPIDYGKLQDDMKLSSGGPEENNEISQIESALRRD